MTSVLCVLVFSAAIHYNRIKKRLFNQEEETWTSSSWISQEDGKRGQERQQGEVGKVLRIDQLSDAVLLRVTKRQAAREIEQLKYILQVTGWDPTILPTPEQMEEIENGTIEF